MKKKTKRKQRRSVNKKPAFLKAFVVCASITDAAAAIGIDRSMHYEWLRKDAKYVKAFAAAEIQAAQTLEDAAIRWAMKGIFEPTIYQGEFCYEQEPKTLCTLPDGREVLEQDLPVDLKAVDIQSRRTIYVSNGRMIGVWRRSEGLMGKLLTAAKPEKYRQNVAAEVTGAGGGPIESALTVTFVRPQ